MKKLLLVAILAVPALAGCTQRFITAQKWQTEKAFVLYTAYQEQSCFGSYCTIADSRVKACTLQPDNSLKCKNLTDAEKVLNN